MGDVVGIVDDTLTMVVEYTYSPWGEILSTTGDEADTIGVINPFRYRGYYYDEETGLYCLNSRYYDPEVGRFISIDNVLGVNADLNTYNLFIYCGNNPIDRYDVGGLFWEDLLDNALHVGNSLAVAIGIDTAAIGAFFLSMEKDEHGVYHATFDCWQQHFGYNNMYDFFFDLGTSCEPAKFEFAYNGEEYILWAWKGDYINLGAGAELGIYYGGEPHWFVDKNLAMPMQLNLKYKGKTIIDYSATTWWITGFNPDYLNVDANDLTATYTVRFTNSGMYNAFRNQWDRSGSGWNFWVEKGAGMASFSY